jgi:DnaJ-class molecular chaperone
MKDECLHNRHLNTFIYINDGEEVCPKCLGKGLTPIKKLLKEKKVMQLTCSKCLGKGKIDWVEKAMQR